MARAWVNFNGTGTVAIRASVNVSSITDNGTGQYTVNFTTAMPDANYSIVGSTIGDTTGATYDSFVCGGGVVQAAGSCRLQSRQHTGSVFDTTCINVAVFR
jgi:hypothetical protein